MSAVEAAGAVTVTIRTCARCDKDHADLTFNLLTAPAGEWTHWALCPTVRQPILLQCIRETPPAKIAPGFGFDSGGDPVLKVCPNCGDLTSESHLYDEDLHYGPPAWTCKRPKPAQPAPALRMTPELERVLRFAERECELLSSEKAIKSREQASIEDAIAAVRAQASQPVKLEKVRALLAYMDSCRPWNSMCTLFLDSALAELDAREGKVTG